MKHAPTLRILLALLLGGTAAHAQDSTQAFLIGIRSGYEPGIQSLRFPVFSPSTDCGEFTGGRSTAVAGGAILLDPFLVSRSLGGALTLDWCRVDGLATATPLDPLYFPDGTIEHEYRFHASWQAIRLGIQLYQQLSRPIGISYGVETGYRFGGRFEQVDTIVGSTDLRFLSGRSAEPMTPEQLTPNPLSLGLAVSGHLRLPLSARVTLMPTLTFRADLLSAVRERSWQTYGMMAGVAILYDVGRREDTLAIPPPATPPPPALLPADPPIAELPEPRSRRLDASVDFYGIDEENHRLPAVTIRVYEATYRRSSGPLGPIYFGRRSAELPESYTRLDRREAESFVVDSLASLGALQLQHQALNLLGSRMKNSPSATIVLAGMASKDEPANLARQRAASVREYLAEAWGIDTARVSITDDNRAMARSNEATAAGRSENRRVEIVTGPSRITGPVLLEKIARDFDPPLIAIEPKFKAEAGVKRWDIALIRDGDTIGRFSSTDAHDPLSDVDWQVSTDRSGVLQTLLIAQLRVEDSLGTIVTTHAQVPLVIERSARTVHRNAIPEESRERIAYTLLPFAHNSSELGTRNEAVINEVAGSVREGARIVVTGYIGGEGSTPELSRARADRTADRLAALLRSRGIRDAAITTVGDASMNGRLPDDIPNDGLISGDVEIIIEQAIPRMGVDRGS